MLFRKSKRSIHCLHPVLGAATGGAKAVDDDERRAERGGHFEQAVLAGRRVEIEYTVARAAVASDAVPRLRHPGRRHAAMGAWGRDGCGPCPRRAARALRSWGAASAST